MSAFLLRPVAAPRLTVSPRVLRVAPVTGRSLAATRELPVVQANPEVQAMYDLSSEEIMGEVFELKKELFNLRSTRAVGNTIKTHLFRKHRKRIAQLLTVYRKKEIELGITKRESRKIEKKKLLKAGAWVR